VPFGLSYIVKTIRLLVYEDMVFDQACDALGNLERAQLMQEAVLFECCRLGVRYSIARPRPLKHPWPYRPTRDGEVTGVRISISMRNTVAELMEAAARHVDVSEPLFIVGSTLAYIGRLQSQYEAKCVAAEEARLETQGALRKIRLPERYRYPPKR
jgi:hypothetical protein